MLHPDICTWVKEHNPQTGEKAAALAEYYTEAHWDPLTKRMTVGKSRFGEGRPYSLGLKVQISYQPQCPYCQQQAKSNFICYYCQQPGHKAFDVSSKKTKVP